MLYFLVNTNKSHFVMYTLCGEPVRVGKLENFYVEYLVVGHSKTRADQVFANVANIFASSNYFNHLCVFQNDIDL